MHEKLASILSQADSAVKNIQDKPTETAARMDKFQRPADMWITECLKDTVQFGSIAETCADELDKGDFRQSGD